MPCGEERHRLRWEGGELRALDHADPESERTLAALGGVRCACVDALDAWAAHAADPRVLVLASRGPGDPLAAPQDDAAPPAPLAPARAPRRGTAMAVLSAVRLPPGGSPARHGPPADPLIGLLDLGGGLPERLVATVAEHWRGQLERPGGADAPERALLHAALHGRLLVALAGWLARPLPELGLELEMIEADGARGLELEPGAERIRAALPFAWLTEVFCRDLAVLLGRFCLAAAWTHGGALALDTVTVDGADRARVTIALG